MRGALGAWVALCLVAASSASAQPQPKRGPCADARTQVEMNECAGKESEKADRELNNYYDRLSAKLHGAHKQTLKAAQLAWVKFRDADCEYQTYLFRDGTIYPLLHSSCLTAKTQARTKELRESSKGMGR